jgi:hypothetical protein
MSNENAQDTPNHRPAVGAQVERGVRRWHRLLWGVVFESVVGDHDAMLIGSLWADDLKSIRYDGEPTRALLFCTRAQARTWCAKKMAGWREGRTASDRVMTRRVRAVRVRETVQVEAPNGSLQPLAKGKSAGSEG